MTQYDVHNDLATRVGSAIASRRLGDAGGRFCHMVGTRHSTPVKKMGRPFLAETQPVCPSTQRSRRWRLRKQLGHAAPAAAALVVRRARAVKPHKPRGRPPMPVDQLTAGGLRRRLWRAARSTRLAVRPFDALLAVAAAAEEAEAAAAAERLRVRLARELATRGHDGPSGFAAVRYTAPSLADASCCVICLEDADDLDGFGLMLCCGNGVCRECLGRSLAQGGKAMKTGYGGCEAKAPPSKCPAGCNASVKSSYRGWACR